MVPGGEIPQGAQGAGQGREGPHDVPPDPEGGTGGSQTQTGSDNEGSETAVVNRPQVRRAHRLGTQCQVHNLVLIADPACWGRLLRQPGPTTF